MGHHRHAAAGEERDGLGQARAAFELDGAAAGFLEHARRRHEGLLLRHLVGPERQVNHDQRVSRAAHHRMALKDHHVERHRDRGLQPVHHHAERIPHQDDVAMPVEDARRMGVIGREHHDRLAALAGANVGSRQPPTRA